MLRLYLRDSANIAFISKMSLHNKLIQYYSRKYKISIKEAEEELYHTRTIQALMDTNTDFYGKSINELKYLLKLELSGDIDEWRRQAIL